MSGSADNVDGTSGSSTGDSGAGGDGGQPEGGGQPDGNNHQSDEVVEDVAYLFLPDLDNDVLAQIHARDGASRPDDTVIGAAMRDGEVVAWLEEGKTGPSAQAARSSGNWIRDDYERGAGWAHIYNNHVDTPEGNHFVGVFGPAYEDPINIQTLILEAANKAPYVPGEEFNGLVSIAGHEMRLSIGDNGFIVTAYPRSRN